MLLKFKVSVFFLLYLRTTFDMFIIILMKNDMLETNFFKLCIIIYMNNTQSLKVKKLMFSEPNHFIYLY